MLQSWILTNFSILPSNNGPHARQTLGRNEVPPGDAYQSLRFRTGAWTFMSIGLLEDPDKVHEILDDLEAIYWTLLYSALHTCKHDGDFGLDILNHCRQEINKDGEETGRTLGGTFKRAALRGPLSLTRSVTFKCEPLQDLFSDLSETLENYYRAVEDLNRAYGRAARHPAGAAIAQEKLNEQRAAISAPLFWSGMIQTALNAPGWISDGDVVNTPDLGPMVG